MIPSPLAHTEVRKTPKSGFWPKNVHWQKFPMSPKSGLWGRGGRKFFGPPQKNVKLLPKKFSWFWPHFWALQATEGEKSTIFGQKWDIAEFSAAEISAMGAGRTPKTFCELQNYFFFSKKIFRSIRSKTKNLFKSLGGGTRGFPP